MVETMRTKSGRVLTNDEIRRLADRAEAGYDLSKWSPRRGRPPLVTDAIAHSPQIAARLPADLHRRFVERVTEEDRTVSDVIRSLVQGYVTDPDVQRPASNDSR